MSSNHQDQQNLVGLLNTATGQNMSPLPNAEANRGIAGNVRNANVDKLGSKVATEARAEKGQMDAVENIQLIGEKFSETEGQIDKAEGVVEGAHKQYVADGPTQAYRQQNAQLMNSDVTKARENLKQEPQTIAEIPRSYMGSQKEAVAQCVQAGLTDAQTMYMSRKLMGAYGDMQAEAYRALFQENQRLYGEGLGGNMSHDEVLALTDDMARNMDVAARGGDHFRAGLGNLVNWNRANTALGENPIKDTIQRVQRVDEKVGLEPQRSLTPQEKATHNRQRGIGNLNNFTYNDK